MPEIKIVEATTFNKALSEIEKYQKKNKSVWYRGCSSANYNLTPSLYRHPDVRAVLDLLEIEKVLTTKFIQRSLPYLNRRLVGDWDTLFLMQHYGVPTRLLDWSENPLISLYFALCDWRNSENDAVLWMCNPEKWNQHVFQHISYQGGVFDENDTNVEKHKPGTEFAEIPDFPVMMFGSYNSPRIVAQKGVFSLFGKSDEPMNVFFERAEFSAGAMQKLVVRAEYRARIFESLLRAGTTEAVVFPELDGLAKELRRENGF